MPSRRESRAIPMPEHTPNPGREHESGNAHPRHRTPSRPHHHTLQQQPHRTTLLLDPQRPTHPHCSEQLQDPAARTLDTVIGSPTSRHWPIISRWQQSVGRVSLHMRETVTRQTPRLESVTTTTRACGNRASWTARWHQQPRATQEALLSCARPTESPSQASRSTKPSGSVRRTDLSHFRW